MRAKVFIVDDDPEMAECLASSINAATGMKCVGVHLSARSALRHLKQAEPDLVLLDLRMKGINGLDCLKALKEARPEVKVVMVSGVIEPEIIKDCFKNGADGYVLKPFSMPKLIEAVWQVMAGGRPVSEAALSVCTGPKEGAVEEQRESFGLTLREIEILGCLRDGLCYKEIAVKLEIALGTVHRHIHNIDLKLETEKSAEAVKKYFAMRDATFMQQ